MFLDEELPKPKSDAPSPRKLENLSLKEMEAYILWLEGEIARTREEIQRKSGHKQLAENFFKKGVEST